jgi:hypothetical protein
MPRPPSSLSLAQSHAASVVLPAGLMLFAPVAMTQVACRRACAFPASRATPTRLRTALQSAVRGWMRGCFGSGSHLLLPQRQCLHCSAGLDPLLCALACGSQSLHLLFNEYPPLRLPPALHPPVCATRHRVHRRHGALQRKLRVPRRFCGRRRCLRRLRLQHRLLTCE